LLSGFEDPAGQAGRQDDGGFGGPAALPDKESIVSAGTIQIALPAWFKSFLFEAL